MDLYGTAALQCKLCISVTKVILLLMFHRMVNFRVIYILLGKIMSSLDLIYGYTTLHHAKLMNVHVYPSIAKLLRFTML